MSARPRNHGFTLIEAMLSSVVVALMLASALAAAGAARVRQEKNATRARAVWLAESLAAEIMDKPYLDPGGISLLGIDLGENQSRRSTLDDVDDYDGLSESPPRDADGNALAGFTGWSRSVIVANVLSSDFRTTTASDTNYKRITVTVTKGGMVLAQLTALRTRARDSW